MSIRDRLIRLLGGVTQFDHYVAKYREWNDGYYKGREVGLGLNSRSSTVEPTPHKGSDSNSNPDGSTITFDNVKFNTWIEARTIIEDVPCDPARVVAGSGFIIGRRVASRILRALNDNNYQVIYVSTNK